MKRRSWLKYCFYVYGLVMATALIFVFVPATTMTRVGSAFGLPPFEVTPMFEYMARGFSAICFFLGVLIIYLGSHLSECARFVRFLGWAALLLLGAVVFVHAKVETPFWWKAGDIFGVFLLCILCLLTPKAQKAS